MNTEIVLRGLVAAAALSAAVAFAQTYPAKPISGLHFPATVRRILWRVWWVEIYGAWVSR